jgi:predicted AlkP superfamily pyrophosphatase or phosphodiesterase
LATTLRLFFAFFFCLLLIGSGVPARAQLMQTGEPRLVLLLVVDQFSYDLFSRFNKKYGPNGFRYLQDNGAVFTNCRYKQATTVTAVGHSIIASGAYPWSTGVVANEWLSGSKGIISAVFDDSTQLVGANGAGASAKSMRGTTFGDSLKMATNGRSKVFAVSLKDRGSIFLAGKLGNGAFWWDTRTGSFVSSSQYGGVLPGWVSKFNDKHYADQFFGKAWQRLLPESEYGSSNRDDYQHEGALPGDGRNFPHVITGGASSPNEAFYTAFVHTPFANQMLADLGREAIEAESLGQHTDPDVLAISFSTPDYAGHLFGQQSQELQDIMLRLDQTIGGLLKYIDGKVGMKNTLVIVTGDHGAAPVPEFVRERGHSRGLDSGRIDPNAFKTLLDSALDSRLGPGDWITAFSNPNLYLNLAEIDRQKYRQPEVEALAAKLARSIPGIAEAYTANQLFTNQMPNGPFESSVRRAYFWGRSGELFVIPKPGYIFSSGSAGTSHGSPYGYDQQVPLIMTGASVQAGKYGQEASPADIAPTVSSILNIPMPPLSEGRVLQEALGQVQGPASPLRQEAQQLSSKSARIP